MRMYAALKTPCAVLSHRAEAGQFECIVARCTYFHLFSSIALYRPVHLPLFLPAPAAPFFSLAHSLSPSLHLYRICKPKRIKVALL